MKVRVIREGLVMSGRGPLKVGETLDSSEFGEETAKELVKAKRLEVVKEQKDG